MRPLRQFVFGIASIILILAGLSLFLKEGRFGTSNSALVIYNWGDYIDPSLLKKFTKETGIPVDYETFDSNEAMYTKIKQGSSHYDIAIPSDYMVSKMAQEGLLEKLDDHRLKGSDKIDSHFNDLPYDRTNDYSVPYFWGTLGIVYNDIMIKDPPRTWQEIFSPQYKDSILLVDGAREGMGISLQSLGYSSNSKDLNELAKAVTHLKELAPNIKAIVSDEIKGYMIQGEAPLAVSYSGEAQEMAARNPHLHYIVPKGTTNLWVDSMVIPKGAEHMDAAYRFINFMLEPKNAAQNAHYIGYATPNKEAQALLEPSVREDTTCYPPPKEFDRMEMYEDLDPEYLSLYNEYYLQFKMTY